MITALNLSDETRFPELVAWLDQMDASWSCDIVVAPEDPRVDYESGLGVNVRLVALDPTLVETYAEAMSNGDQFPPVVLRITGGKLVPLCGNHRLAAAIVASVSLDAVVIRCSDEAAFKIAFGDNARHGKPPTDLERCRVAIRLMDNFGMSMGAAARFCNVGKGRIGGHRRAIRFSKVYAEAGGDPRVFAQSHQARLAQVEDSQMMVALADVLARMPGATWQEISDVVSALNAAADQAARRAIVDQFASDLEYRRTKMGRTEYSRALDMTLAFADLDSDRILDTVPSPESGEYLAERCIRAAKHLMTLAQELRRP